MRPLTNKHANCIKFQQKSCYFLVALALVNVAVGFYKSFNKSKQSSSTQINYKVKTMNLKKSESSVGMSVDYISKANEMLEIFNKYNFSVDSFLKDESANLIIFSSLPDDFMEIQSVNERKKTIYSYPLTNYIH